jgi:hypothetical protein
VIFWIRFVWNFLLSIFFFELQTNLLGTSKYKEYLRYHKEQSQEPYKENSLKYYSQDQSYMNSIQQVHINNQIAANTKEQTSNN